MWQIIQQPDPHGEDTKDLLTPQEQSQSPQIRGIRIGGGEVHANNQIIIHNKGDGGDSGLIIEPWSTTENQNCSAVGLGAMAVGVDCHAQLDYSIAMGYGAHATGFESGGGYANTTQIQFAFGITGPSSTTQYPNTFFIDNAQNVAMCAGAAPIDPTAVGEQPAPISSNPVLDVNGDIRCRGTLRVADRGLTTTMGMVTINGTPSTGVSISDLLPVALADADNVYVKVTLIGGCGGGGSGLCATDQLLAGPGGGGGGGACTIFFTTALNLLHHDNDDVNVIVGSGGSGGFSLPAENGMPTYIFTSAAVLANAAGGGAGQKGVVAGGATGGAPGGPTPQTPDFPVSFQGGGENGGTGIQAGSLTAPVPLVQLPGYGGSAGTFPHSFPSSATAGRGGLGYSAKTYRRLPHGNSRRL